MEPILYMIVIIMGLSIGLIIGSFIFQRIKYKGPDSNEVKKEIHEDKNGKYRWIPKVCICPISYSFFKLKDKDYIDEH